MKAVCLMATITLLLCSVMTIAQTDPAFKPVVDNPNLPKVLLIGDSISIGYTVPVQNLLAGKANVHRAIENCQSSNYALERIKVWLGDGKWDVIHFNWGIWDAHHFSNGTMRTTPEQYEKNLRQLVSILKSTKAKLIWATTTPVATRQHGDLGLVSTDIPEYSTIARKVMRENHIPIDDLFADVMPYVNIYRSDDGCHYTQEGYEFLGKHVAKCIDKVLNPIQSSSTHSVKLENKPGK